MSLSTYLYKPHKNVPIISRIGYLGIVQIPTVVSMPIKKKPTLD